MNNTETVWSLWNFYKVYFWSNNMTNDVLILLCHNLGGETLVWSAFPLISRIFTVRHNFIEINFMRPSISHFSDYVHWQKEIQGVLLRYWRDVSFFFNCLCIYQIDLYGFYSRTNCFLMLKFCHCYKTKFVYTKSKINLRLADWLHREFIIWNDCLKHFFSMAVNAPQYFVIRDERDEKRISLS